MHPDVPSAYIQEGVRVHPGVFRACGPPALVRVFEFFVWGFVCFFCDVGFSLCML